MEDQRNWTDASYKTYVRPLALPWGYTLAKGSRHEQSVQLSFDGRLEGRGEEKGSDVRITLGGNLATNMPDLGVALPAEEARRRSPPADGPAHSQSTLSCLQRRCARRAGACRARSLSKGRGGGLRWDRPRNRHPRRAGRRRFAGAGRRSRSSRALDTRIGRRLERGRFEILAARCNAPRETDGRRDPRSRARCFSGRKAWRRHALHLHRTQSEAT